MNKGKRPVALGRESLLREYAERQISNSFADRRINKSALDRFTAEHRRRFKISKRAASRMKFALGDEEITLTHRGRALGDEQSTDDDNEGSESGGELSAEHVHESHFGGHRSKAEVMREVMCKSKRHKAERQAQHRMDEELQDELDEEFGDIRGLLSFAPKGPVASVSGAFEDIVTTLQSERKKAVATSRTPSSAEKAAYLRDAEQARLARELDLPESEQNDHESEDTNAYNKVMGNVHADEEETEAVVEKHDKASEKAMRLISDGGSRQNEISVYTLLEQLLEAVDQAGCGQEWFVERILQLEATVRILPSDLLRGFAVAIQKLLFAPLEAKKLFLLGIIIERIFSVTDARHSVATVFVLVLTGQIYSFEHAGDILRGSLLLLRLAGARRHLVSEAIHGLNAVLELTATPFKAHSCETDDVAAISDWELFMGPLLQAKRMASIAQAALCYAKRRLAENQPSADSILCAPMTMLVERRVKAPRLLEPVLADHLKKRRDAKDEGSYLRSAHRREHRGAIRELRRDTKVLASVKHAAVRQRREANSALAGRPYTLH